MIRNVAGAPSLAEHVSATRTAIMVPSKPAVLQSLFVALYAGLWYLGWVIVPGIGRPEKLVVVIGMLAVPVAIGCRSKVPPTMVWMGLVGLLGTYVLSYYANDPSPEGLDLVISLTARVLFLWICFVNLQNAIILQRAVWLLICSSLVSAGVALAVMAKYGVGIGRLDPVGLEATLDPFTFSTFASAQLATMGGLLLLGTAWTLTSRGKRLAATAGSLVIFGTAYLCYFRREHLISIPVLLLTFALGGDRSLRRRALAATFVAIVGFAAVAVWDYSREESVLQTRIESEFGGGVVDPVETRLTNFQAELKAIADRPLRGFGAGTHTAAIAPYAQPGERFLSSFNLLAWLAVEGGLPCAFSYLVLLMGVGRVVWRYRLLPGSGPHALILRCGPVLVLQIVLWGIFGNAWDLPLGWFVLGLILAAARLAGDAPPAGAGDRSRFGRGIAYAKQPPRLMRQLPHSR